MLLIPFFISCNFLFSPNVDIEVKNEKNYMAFFSIKNIEAFL